MKLLELEDKKYGFMFDSSCVQWLKHPEENRMFIEHALQGLNHKLEVRGWLDLEDIAGSFWDVIENKDEFYKREIFPLLETERSGYRYPKEELKWDVEWNIDKDGHKMLDNVFWVTFWLGKKEDKNENED